MKSVFKLCTAIALLCLGTAAHAEWRKFETAHFIIYSQSSEKKVTELATRLEAVDGLMHMATNLSQDVEPVKVRIYELADEGEVQAAIGAPGSGIAGFYTSNSLGPFAVTLRRIVADVGNFTPELVLHHEYAHHFMLQYFPASYPIWYTEGFAEMIGASRMMSDGRIAYGFPAKYRGDELAFAWTPMRDVLLKPIEKLKTFDLYGQGWAMTHFLTFTPGRSKQLRMYLAALSSGRTAEEASKAFGDLDKLDREAHAYVSQGSFEYKPVKVPLHEPVIEREEPISAAEAALIPDVVAFSDDDLNAYTKAGAREKERARRARVLADARKVARSFPNDPYALYVLAEMENAGGNAAEAEAATDRLLSLQPNNAHALVRKSLLLSDAALKLTGPARAAKAAEARHLAVVASKADPNEARAFVAFFQSYRAAGEPPTTNAVGGLEAAVATLPRDTDIRQMLVDEYARQHRWRDAIRTLGPIASNLDRSPLSQAIQQKMEWLKAQMARENPVKAATAS